MFNIYTVIDIAFFTGLEDLMVDLENNILNLTGRKFWRFVLPTGSDEIRLVLIVCMTAGIGFYRLFV